LRFLYSFTIGCSSVLLFSVQPIMAKALLPKFGGSAGVWVTCMVFFQVMLLLGYLYSWLLTTCLSRRAQSAVHATLLMLSVAVMLWRPSPAWSQAADTNPAWPILGMLLVSVGLPYSLLSTSSPLMQAWFSAAAPVGSPPRAFPYWLFALSNAASLLALLAYPAIVEPRLPQSLQMHWWWLGYSSLAALVLATAIMHWRGPSFTAKVATPAHPSGRPLLWIGLAACASALWMAVANHLSREVAPVPFLWVLQLGIYLLSFILCFDGRNWYRPALFRWLLPAAWLGAGCRIAGYGPAGLLWDVAMFSLALFVWCMFCHGEIARTKPADAHGTTFFYLTLALGGAVGAVLVGLAAPNLLDSYLELPIGIAASVLLALHILYGMKSQRLVRLGVLAAATFLIASRFASGFGEVIRLRNFYGALLVSDAESGGSAIRTLYNGRTLHGVEFLSPEKNSLPTAYYGPESGVGKLLLARGDRPRRVGMVGLGVGTLAAYGHPGDLFRFYEIDPAVIGVARRYFQFLGTSQASIDVRPGDGRLELAREPSQSFDILVLDAFADDSIPVHLLTTEAFETYFRLLRQDGVLAIHLTNRFLDLAPVVESVTANGGMHVVEIHSAADPDRQILAADWALVAEQADTLTPFGSANPHAKRVRAWTDDYSSLFQALK
jgi:spermidine synthase